MKHVCLGKADLGPAVRLQEVKCQHRALQPYLGAQAEAEARSVPAEEEVAVLEVHSERVVAVEAPSLGSSSEVAQGKERGLWHQHYPGQDEVTLQWVTAADKHWRCWTNQLLTQRQTGTSGRGKKEKLSQHTPNHINQAENRDSYCTIIIPSPRTLLALPRSECFRETSLFRWSCSKEKFTPCWGVLGGHPFGKGPGTLNYTWNYA